MDITLIRPRTLALVALSLAACISYALLAHGPGLLRWFGQNQAAFFVVAYAATAVFLLLAIQPTGTSSRTARISEGAYCAAILFTLFAWRWPVLISPVTLNPDEAQMVANALKATVDPAPWRGFDGTTSGPLNSDVLVLAGLFGAHIDLFSARVIGLLLIAGTLCALYFAIRWSYDATIARICVAPAVLLFAFVRNPEFVHYSSEHLSLFLTTVALACAAFVASGRGGGRARLWPAMVAGASAGCTFFSKLQAFPLALVVFAYLLAAVVVSRRAARGSIAMEFGAALGGLAIPVVLILGAVAFTGEWNDFIVSYLKSASAYVASGAPITVGFYFNSESEYTNFLQSAILFCIVCVALLVVVRVNFAKIGVLAPISSVALLLAALFAIYAPHKPFPHYLLLSIVPITWCLANLLALVYETSPSPRLRVGLSAAYVFMFTVPALFGVAQAPDNFVKDIPLNSTFPESSVGIAIEQYVPRGARISIWGWMPQYYVETGTIMATRDAHTQRQIEAGPLQDYFRDRYLRDVTETRPQLILEAVGPGQAFYNDRAKQGIDTFPLLAVFVQQNYQFAEEVGGIRIFRLRDVQK